MGDLEEKVVKHKADVVDVIGTMVSLGSGYFVMKRNGMTKGQILEYGLAGGSAVVALKLLKRYGVDQQVKKVKDDFVNYMKK